MVNRFVASFALLASVGCRTQGALGQALSPYCQAPLGLSVEVTRLLTMAAAHGTRSAACADGPGTHVTVDEVLVCPIDRQQREIVVAAGYRVTRTAEGDTRTCGDCSWTDPRSSTHETKLRFSRTGAHGAFRIDLPALLPGIADMTPLDRKHEGDCYGRIGPFVPADVELD